MILKEDPGNISPKISCKKTPPSVAIGSQTDQPTDVLSAALTYTPTDTPTYSPIYSISKNYVNRACAHGYNQLQQFIVNIIFIMANKILIQ